MNGLQISGYLELGEGVVEGYMVAYTVKEGVHVVPYIEQIRKPAPRETG
ncbi:hypothetical protein [Paenibacillus sp. 481]|nr:hypothetical protein [Paenibacillus sp. 481]UHA73376.1 hypothetical protein KIK04_22890 [Paenibacillus sp. 481]